MESLPAYRKAWGRIGSIAVGILAMLIATTGTGSAQTWSWQYVAHPANSAPINAHSTVVLSPSEVSIEYSAPIEHRNAVIESCRVALNDVQHVAAVRTRGPIFLVIQLKPQHTANCDSGRRPVAAIPGDDFNVVSQVAGAINQACCSAKGPPTVAHAATPRPSAKPRVAVRPPSPPPTAKPRVVAQASPTPPPPTPKPTPPPTVAPTATPATPAPSPSPSGPPGIRLEDWVENQGLFSFVRVRNYGRQSVTIDSGEVLDCKNVESGCGPLPHRFTLDPYSTATIATVASTGQFPSFSYRYSAEGGKFNGSGSVTKRPPARVARMSAEAIRVAEAAAINALRSPGPAPVATQNTYTPPRLTKRGSSRLGIGQTGTAQVRLLISPNGSPQEATVVSITNRALTAAAIETAVSSTYAPATRNGQPVPANYVVTFSFNGEDPATADVPVWRRPASTPPAASAGSPSPQSSSH